MMADIDYKVTAVTVNKEDKINRGLLTEDLYELGVKYGLIKIEDFLNSQIGHGI